jgi:hypothetical protein
MSQNVLPLIDFVEQKLVPCVVEQLSHDFNQLFDKHRALSLMGDLACRKTAKTLGSICLLEKNAFYQDALVLARTIFESMLNLAFVCCPKLTLNDSEQLAWSYIVHPEEEKRRKRRELENKWVSGKCLLWKQLFEKQRAQLEKLSTSLESIPNFHQALDQIFEDYKRWRAEDLPGLLEKIGVQKKNLTEHCKKSSSGWCALSVKEMAEAVGDPFLCDYPVIYWMLSAFAHSSNRSSHGYFESPFGIEVKQEKEAVLLSAMYVFEGFDRAALKLDFPARSFLQRLREEWLRLVEQAV